MNTHIYNSGYFSFLAQFTRASVMMALVLITNSPLAWARSAQSERSPGELGR
jgi:hypothetical protein